MTNESPIGSQQIMSASEGSSKMNCNRCGKVCLADIVGTGPWQSNKADRQVETIYTGAVVDVSEDLQCETFLLTRLKSVDKHLYGYCSCDHHTKYSATLWYQMIVYYR